MTLRFQVCLAWVLLGIVVPVAAQQRGAVAGIRGRVIDPQRQGVEARVQVIQVTTALERETRSDAAGYFAVTSIPPGDIDVIVTAQVFAERRIQGIRLEVGQTAEVEIPLRLSAIAEQITVAGDAGTVDVLGSLVGTVISAREIESLPLNGRNFLELAFLTPGSAPAPNFDPTKTQSVMVPSAGQAGRGGNITIDGMDDNDDVVGGPLMNITQDAVQEFQVATNRFAAEQGRSAGSVINVVTRSGTDTPRGSAALFYAIRAGRRCPSCWIAKWSATRRSIDSRRRLHSAVRSSVNACSASEPSRSAIRTAGSLRASATPPPERFDVPMRSLRSTTC